MITEIYTLSKMYITTKTRINFTQDILDSITHGGAAWCDPNIWSDMEYDFNYELEAWWQDIYDDMMEEKKDELLESGDYYEEKED